MRVVHEGKEYDVVFAGEWHNPPLPGAINVGRIRHTTRCVIGWDGAGGRGEVCGEAHLSVADRYSEERGCCIALERAVRELFHLPRRWAPYGRAAGVVRHFTAAVMPVVAREAAARRRATRRTRPGVHAYARALDRAALSMAVAVAVIKEGPEHAFRGYVDTVFKEELSARLSRAKAAAKRRAAVRP